MGVRICTDSLPDKFLIRVFSYFLRSITCVLFWCYVSLLVWSWPPLQPNSSKTRRGTSYFIPSQSHPPQIICTTLPYPVPQNGTFGARAVAKVFPNSVSKFPAWHSSCHSHYGTSTVQARKNGIRVQFLGRRHEYEARGFFVLIGLGKPRWWRDTLVWIWVFVETVEWRCLYFLFIYLILFACEWWRMEGGGW